MPTISAMRCYAERIRRAEVAKTLARLPDLSDEEKLRIESLSEAIVKKLLHRPISRLKAKAGGPAVIEAARELFGIDEKATDP